MHTGDADILLLRRRSPFDEGELSDTGLSRRFDIDPRWRDRYPEGVTENLEYEWRYRLPGRADIRLNPGEHDDYCWLPLPQAAGRVWSWSNREALLGLGAALS